VSEPDGAAGASPLELLHPAGGVHRVLVDGTRCPTGLVPPRAAPATSDVELALLAPSAVELTRRGWLERSVAAAARALAKDGVLYVILPPVARVRARRRLSAAGLTLDTSVAHLPAGAPRHLIPLAREPWRYMLAQEVGAHARIRGGLLAAARLPLGERLLSETLPAVAVVARAPGAPRPAAWIGGLGGEARATAHLATLTSWRGPEGAIVAHCFADGEDAPWGVAKVASSSEREARGLDALGGAAGAAGATVPRVLAVGAVPAGSVVIESVVGGRPAARALMAHPERYAEVAGRLADWLERWAAVSARRGELTRARLEHELLRHDLPPSYRDWLGARCEALPPGALGPATAAHQDLTMWNVRFDEVGEMGVLDWAEARPDAVPLMDLFYGLADAAAACDGYRDRLAAFRSCFDPAGARSAIVAPLSERLRQGLQISPEVGELCFHACSLHHAANEARRPAAQRPFAEIVRWLGQRAGTL
jgi:hypothetical protein